MLKFREYECNYIDGRVDRFEIAGNCNFIGNWTKQEMEQFAVAFYDFNRGGGFHTFHLSLEDKKQNISFDGVGYFGYANSFWEHYGWNQEDLRFNAEGLFLSEQMVFVSYIEHILFSEVVDYEVGFLRRGTATEDNPTPEVEYIPIEKLELDATDYVCPNEDLIQYGASMPNDDLIDSIVERFKNGTDMTGIASAIIAETTPKYFDKSGVEIFADMTIQDNEGNQFVTVKDGRDLYVLIMDTPQMQSDILRLARSRYPDPDDTEPVYSFLTDLLDVDSDTAEELVYSVKKEVEQNGFDPYIADAKDYAEEYQERFNKIYLDKLDLTQYEIV